MTWNDLSSGSPVIRWDPRISRVTWTSTSPGPCFFHVETMADVFGFHSTIFGPLTKHEWKKWSSFRLVIAEFGHCPNFQPHNLRFFDMCWHKLHMDVTQACFSGDWEWLGPPAASSNPHYFGVLIVVAKMQILWHWHGFVFLLNIVSTVCRSALLILMLEK